MMHTDDEAPHKKKSDKSHTSTENLTVSVEKHDTSKKSDQGETEDPKPRIVLTFRSEKTSAKSSNMKIVSTEESAPRRSSRTRSKWEWICDSDPSASPKKDKIISLSENDESDSSYTPPRLRRRRSKDDMMSRKEKSYNESAIGPTQRLSRRIKPTAKILANEELRIGLECQNNARLGIQTDKSPEEGVRTRRSAKPTNIDEKKEPSEIEVVEIDDDSQSQTSQVMKLKHLCELGLKAINPGAEDDESPNEKEDNDGEVLDDEEIDDDSEVISKLLEADEDTAVEDSDEDFYCSEEASQSERPRRSSRLCSSFGVNDSDRSSPPPGDEEQKTPRRRRSSRQAARHSYTDNYDRPKRKRNHSCDREDVQSEAEHEETSNPAGGDEGVEAACPEGESTIVATCLCEKAVNVFAAPSELTDPVFCQAIEMVDGIRVGCSHAARKEDDGTYSALVRAGPRAPYFLACTLHTMQIRKHMCCPACGLFCSQGIFYQCSEGHLFHLECGLPYNDTKSASRPGCPHCGVFSYRWQPANRECWKVNVLMKCSNKRIFLPDQREQCTPAYLSFSTLEPSQLEHDPVIPEDLLPSVDVKELFAQAKGSGSDVTAQQLCEAILAGETVQHLIPMIARCLELEQPVYQGGTCMHASARVGHVHALHALAQARAHLDALDDTMRTPLLRAVQALLDKSETKSKDKLKDISKDSTEEIETDQSKEVTDEAEEKNGKIEKKGESETATPKDEDLMKVIRYLVAAGCDVNIAGPEGMTALHMGAQHGSVAVCGAVLSGAGAHVDPKDHGGWTPLVWAAENNHVAVLRLVLSLGAEPCVPDLEGNQPVHWCALAGAAAALRLLLHAEPHALHALNRHGDTPLHVAARQGHYACVVILLARGARTEVENSAGELPVEVCSGQCKNAILLNMEMKLALADKFTRKRILTSDISNGREAHPIPCVNDVDDAPAPDDFTYVTSHVMPAPLAIDNTIQSLQGCSCVGECGTGGCTGSGCACCVLSVRRWYTCGRLPPTFPYHDPPMLFECNHTCRCNAKTCGNRVVSNLSAHGSVGPRVQVYRVGGPRGWGLRAGAHVQRGTPVALYCGELLTLAQADTRTKDYYMFALDVKPDLLEQCPDKTQLCVDAAQYGSAARFINHSCSPNLAPVRVFTNTRDLRLPTVTLFATKDIQLGEEFTFDYGDKFWSVKSKYMNCECGNIDCKYPVKSTEETE